jgi:hypothetical protein
MDAAGEWRYYWPRSGRPIEELEIVAPISSKPVQIVGPDKDRPVRGLSFRGLEFVGSDQDPEGVWYLFKDRCNDTPKRFRTGEAWKLARAGNWPLPAVLRDSHGRLPSPLLPSGSASTHSRFVGPSSFLRPTRAEGVTFSV